MRKIKIRLALWCYRRGWVRLACKISPSIGWYIIGADFAKTFNMVMSAISALGEGYYERRSDDTKEGL